MISLLGRGAEAGQRLPGGRGGPAGAPLVEQQHPVVIERAAEPAVPAVRARGAEPGAALEEEQPGQAVGGPVRRRDLPGEDLDPLALRAVVVERDGKGVVGEYGTGLAVAGHDQHGTALS